MTGERELAAGELLAKIRDLLTANGVSYLIARNYSGYPTHITGDVDLYLPLEQLRPLLDVLRRLVTQSGWIPLRVVNRPWVVVLRAVNRGAQGDRRILTLEFFDRFTWLGFEYLSFETVARQVKLHNGFRVLPSDVGYLVTICHYFFWVGFLPAKYQTDVAATLGAPKWREITSTMRWISPRLWHQIKRFYALASDEWTRRPGVPEDLFVFPRPLWLASRTFLICSLLVRSPLRATQSLWNIVRTVLRDVRSPAGRVVVVDLDDRIAEGLLFQFKKFHVYSNTRSKLTPVRTLTDGIRALLLSMYAKLRGGVAILNLNKSEPVARRVVLKLMRRTAPDLESVDEDAQDLLARFMKGV